MERTRENNNKPTTKKHMAAKSKTIKFIKDKDTKHMTRFQEQPAVGEPPVCNNLYVAKWFCGDAVNIEIDVRIP